MLPSGPLVIVIVPGGEEWMKKNTAAINSKQQAEITPTVTPRLMPKLSAIIVRRPGIGLEFFPVTAWDGKSLVFIPESVCKHSRGRC
jgi:hypothetical protein